MANETKGGQINSAVIGAAVAVAIALGGFLYQNGQLNGALDSLEYREQRIESKVDLVYEELVDLRERNARLEEQVRISLASDPRTP